MDILRCLLSTHSHALLLLSGKLFVTNVFTDSVCLSLSGLFLSIISRFGDGEGRKKKEGQEEMPSFLFFRQQENLVIEVYPMSYSFLFIFFGDFYFYFYSGGFYAFL